MSDPEVILTQTSGAVQDSPAGDVVMGGAGDVEVVQEETAGTGDATAALPKIEPEVPKRTTFLESPVVELVVGTGDAATSLSAHQGLLVQSPYFEEACANFSDSTVRRIVELPSEDLEATGSFLEWLYVGEYFPRCSSQSLEPDPSIPNPDDSGTALLRHARVYTLAQKLQLPALATLAHLKIHKTSSTAKGEIAYARYVYTETGREDTVIRKPVAVFWATRSHVLRHEAEEEFRRMCLEFPQFGFDVLSLVLDAQEKRSARVEAAGAAGGSARKRARVSQG
ncbi:hypothetical protein B0A49_02631 [Cryomyces minteri]|uniref:BTB domain-containing protein n=1 Tax=Cryomyces minteri TaxID=331657 RepID=A0A4U0XB78_9PEZI|nr:hypothetical protein B0A49_02631 [Cryomyces minteri]